MDYAQMTREDDDDMMGDSVCSTLSDCSLLECNRGFNCQSESIQYQHQFQHLRQHQHPRSQLPPAGGDCLGGAKNFSEIGDQCASAAFRNDIIRCHPGDSVGFGDNNKGEEDVTTFRSTVMHQFKDDIDRLVQTVALKVENLRSASGFDTGCSEASANPSNVYSAVKSSCLSLLLSRVLPPLLERIEQRLIGSLHSAGLLPSTLTPAFWPQPPVQCSTGSVDVSEAAFCPTSVPPVQLPPLPLPPPPSPPKPTPRLRASAEPLQLMHHTQTHSVPAAKRFRHLQCDNHVSSPFFTSTVAASQSATAHPKTSATAVTAPPAVRNNSSLKPQSPTAPSSAPSTSCQRNQQRRPPQPSSAPASSSDLVHTFMIRDSPTLRAILFDPDDRKIKSVSQRYGCYISMFEKTKRAGHLLHKVVIRAPNEKALRMCINALDNSLNWDLASQLNRTSVKKAATNSASTLAK